MRNLRGFNSGGKKNEELKEEMLKNYGVGKDAFEKYSSMVSSATRSKMLEAYPKRTEAMTLRK